MTFYGHSFFFFDIIFLFLGRFDTSTFIFLIFPSYLANFTSQSIKQFVFVKSTVNFAQKNLKYYQLAARCFFLSCVSFSVSYATFCLNLQCFFYQNDLINFLSLLKFTKNVYVSLTHILSDKKFLICGIKIHHLKAAFDSCFLLKNKMYILHIDQWLSNALQATLFFGFL